MRDFFNVARVFALIAVFGLSAAVVGCGQPDNGGEEAGASTTPTAELGGAESGSSLGGGAEVPEAGDDAAPSEDAAPAEGDAPAEEAKEAAPAEEAKEAAE